MDQYAPPPGPPPPQVPPGWKAQFNEQYREWCVIISDSVLRQSAYETVAMGPAQLTGASPLIRRRSHRPTTRLRWIRQPPALSHASDTKKPFDSNNPYGAGATAEDDAALAARLQAEGQAGGAQDRTCRAWAQATTTTPRLRCRMVTVTGNRRARAPLHQASTAGIPARPRLRRRVKTTERTRAEAGNSGGYGGYPQQGAYGHQPGHGAGGMLGGLMGGGGSHGGGMMGGSHGAGMMGHAPPRKGMGAGGAAALGVGGGVVGGMMLADAMHDSDHEERW
ncbi:hypothetical protein EPUS_07611 [Endocarpon pusillum Z07020]|uniref:WW domain-containing protein n=1 Tax=Endocarpon pusillum (strain Z07020 / HMAS-L-300199) TaxID=1263415 RepID=U1GF31_ENDPU|nr:uncharacterized protein EPUS_07611 [Endocarpon pusillum Z07020]ERF70346.1 hypothetical protein EPUS_07611 [Endocarpon pusillum Z07020]